MRSMTGFGRGEAVAQEFAVNIEIKTVNNRYLDINLKLNNELQPYEAALKKQIGERLSRGRVDVYIQFERTAAIEFELNRPLITGYLSALGELKEDFGLEGEPDLNFVARLPNALQTKKEEAGEEFENGIHAAMASALEKVQSMREAEGMTLKQDLVSLLSAISDSLPAIESEAEKVTEEYLERLEKRIAHLLSKTDSQIELDQARLAQEAAYLADKSDISEEISRLKSHLEQFSAIMDENGTIGKRLDFLTQELNREANTIASKTQNLVIKESALRIKADIEKIREQVQNVE